MIRRLAVTAALGIALALFAFAGWQWGVPRYRPIIGEGEVYGLDVSHHQGVIDWETVATDNIDFVYIKATEGSDFVDPRFKVNYQAAQASGLRVSAYHFFTFCSPGATQAENFLKIVGEATANGGPDLPLAIDLEFGGNCGEANRSEDLDAEVSDFFDVIEAATGESMMVYQLEGFEGDQALPSVDADPTRPRWVRHLFRRPAGDWTIWQLHHRAEVSGVDGPVDLNVGVGL